MGCDDSSVMECWTEMSQVQIPAGAAELFSPGSAFCADSYCGIRFIPALLQSRIKLPGCSAKECW